MGRGEEAAHQRSIVALPGGCHVHDALASGTQRRTGGPVDDAEQRVDPTRTAEGRQHIAMSGAHPSVVAGGRSIDPALARRDARAGHDATATTWRDASRTVGRLAATEAVNVKCASTIDSR